MALTKKQRALVDELQEMRDLMLLNYEQIEEYPAPSRTTSLLLMRNKLVRGQVVVSYTLIDEFLTNRLCRFIFGRQRSFPDLWKTKRFRLFNHYVVESLSLLEKLRFAKAIQEIPKPIAKDIESLNVLRNGLAHSFFPENLRSAKPVWKGDDVFTIVGFRRFHEDMQQVFDHFWGDES